MKSGSTNRGGSKRESDSGLKIKPIEAKIKESFFWFCLFSVLGDSASCAGGADRTAAASLKPTRGEKRDGSGSPEKPEGK